MVPESSTLGYYYDVWNLSIRCIGSLADATYLWIGTGVEIWHSIATINGLISIFWVVYSLVRVLIGQLRIYSCILLNKYCSKVEGRSSIFASQRFEGTFRVFTQLVDFVPYQESLKGPLSTQISGVCQWGADQNSI